ncbi:MAG: phage head morphogenesis protein [Lachnospiraceae bacterium]|nr:phage head morphogenesis protein [Lachnospiraceae bacterium]
MNKFQKEVLQSQLNDEKYVIKLLKKVYEQARKDCEQKIRELSSRTDLENLQSIIYQKQYQEALKKQLDGILDNLQSEEFISIADYLQKCYENGYVGVMYDLYRQGIPIIMPINQEQVVKALQTDSKLSNSLYNRLGEDVSYLKKSIRAELSRGIANDSTWNQIAGHIANGMNSPFNKSINNAIRIARTEGHRIQQRSALDAQYAAKEKGADVLKQWDSTLDNRTRPHHRQLDGQVRELEEDFEVDGMTAPAPGHFGRASEDCNCRCCLLQRARWALDQDELDTLKERAAFYGLDKKDSFDDFREKYLHIDK